MRKKAAIQIPRTFVSLMLTLSILLSFGTLTVGAEGAGGASAPDRNILAYTLQEARQAVERGTVDTLVPAVKTEFLAALAAAEAVYADPAATREAIQQSYKALQTVIWTLSYTKADKTALSTAIATAKATSLVGYTSGSVAALNAAVTAAEALLANENLSAGDAETIAAAAKAITDAIAALVTSGGSGGSSSGKPAVPEKPVIPEKPAETKPVTETFADVKAGSWYVADVQYVVDAGLMQGDGTGFKPEGKMSRAMLMTVLYRMAGSPAQEGADGAWYAGAMAWAAGAGLTDGTAPKREISREELAVLLYRYAKASAATADLTAFTDAGSVSSWAAEAMQWAVSTQLMKGKEGGALDPKGTASRAEVAALLARFEQMNKKA